PVLVLAGEQVQRPLADEPPQRTLELSRRTHALVRGDPQRREQHREYGLLGMGAVGAYQAVADRVRAGARVPALDQAPRLGAARMTGERRLVEQPEEQLLPALEEARPVIELDGEHVLGRDGPRERHEVVADLAGARAEIVFRAERR